MPAIAGIGAAVAGLIGVGGTAGVLLGAAVNVGLSVGLSYGMNALFGGGSGAARTQGSQTTLTFGGAQPRQVIFGRAGVAGRLVYWNTHSGSDRQRLNLVFTLADWQCDGLDAVWINGQRKTLIPQAIPGGATEHARFYVAGYGDKCIISFFDGRWGQVADARLVSTAIPAGNWTTNDQLNGICYVSVELDYDEDLWGTSIPQFIWNVRGARLYDLRKDSTNGGSGAHRWDNPLTWEFSENPAVCDYNFRRGFYRNGQRILGMGALASELLTNHYTAAANVCDEIVSEGSQSVARYRVSAIVSADDENRTACAAFTDAMAGFAYERAGQFAVIAGAAQTPIASITNGDLIAGAELRVSARRTFDQLINAGFGTFLDPASGWEMMSFEPVTNAGWESEDGDRRGQSFDLAYVPSQFQARRIATIRLNETRAFQATATITTSYRFIHVEPGDWVTYANTALGTKTYRVMSRTRNPDRTLTFSLSEIGAAAYSGITQPTVTPARTDPTAPVRAQTVQGFTLSPGSETATNQALPSIIAQWVPPGDSTIVAVVIEYRKVGDTQASTFISRSPESGVAKITTNILAATNYEARATIQTEPLRVTAWTLYVGVTTDATYLVPSAAGTGASGLQSTLDAISAQVNSDAFRTYRAEAMEKSRLSLEALQSFRRDWDDASEAATQVNAIAVGVNENTASIVTEQIARANADSALASQVTSVQALADQATANAAFKMEAVAAPGGTAARIAAFVQAGGSTQFNRAGWALDVVEGPPGTFSGRFVVSADQFTMSDDGTIPFTVIDGVTYIKNAIIQNAAINTARIDNNAVTNIWSAEQFAEVGTNVVAYPAVGDDREEIISVTTNRTPGTSAFIIMSSKGYGEGTKSTLFGSEDVYRYMRYALFEYDGSGNQIPGELTGATIFGSMAWGRQEGSSANVYKYNGFLFIFQKVTTASRSGTVRYALKKNKKSQFANMTVIEFKR
jgi:hypothetical protein